MPIFLRFSNDVSRAAVRGERLPGYYTHGLDLCTIHAIRHNDEFARHCETSEDKRYARARNARLIMSNEVPDMATDDVKPYCYWHPDTASEETYHQLVKRYPEMAYSVGRACAVAGYDGLYHKLDILPEVSTAEEARERSSLMVGSKAIFDHIMRQPICYAVLDDYTRSINHQNPRSPAFMNGDTAVRSTLDVTATLPREHVELFYTPLPYHLPTIAKDPLIVMAAYEGNLDRYLRLRRPTMVEHERLTVLRGIYHNTTFAKWWSLQEGEYFDIKAATLARFNEELAKRRPDMHLQVAMACIAGDYKKLWDKLAPEPCRQLWEHASQRDDSIRNHYVDYLERRATELGTDVRRLSAQSGTRADDQCWDAARFDKEPTTTLLCRKIIIPGSSNYPESDSIYGGHDEQATLTDWELHICSSKEMLARIHKLGQSIRLYSEYDRAHWTAPETPSQVATEVDSK
ncbi:hypothetical protein CONLIGDRAFT_651942 [Coniochaeta ligniaria NRRL 30616]|uniref:Uncharacterized protein n=1 Tax=Coniochaeta ligniaria NRRL 30616 TaxID=1408157 RepID=A0A1J7JIV6_9PEZI|nr:hypothetical protein CONLIGDRAFT_651942 [Coniochaeta ligniaria NRRL 30616]